MGTPQNFDWNIERGPSGYYSWEDIHAALLMDIRAELRKLNTVFACPNAIEIPNILREIRRNTTKRKYVRRKK